MNSDLNQDLAAHCEATKTKIVPLLFQCALGFHCGDELF